MNDPRLLVELRGCAAGELHAELTAAGLMATLEPAVAGANVDYASIHVSAGDHLPATRLLHGFLDRKHRYGPMPKASPPRESPRLLEAGGFVLEILYFSAAGTSRRDSRRTGFSL